MRSKRFLKDGSEVLQMSTEALEVSSWLGTAWRNAKPSGALRRPLRLAWGRRVVETRWKFFRPYRELDPGLVGKSGKSAAPDNDISSARQPSTPVPPRNPALSLKSY